MAILQNSVLIFLFFFFHWSILIAHLIIKDALKIDGWKLQVFSPAVQCNRIDDLKRGENKPIGWLDVKSAAI